MKIVITGENIEIERIIDSETEARTRERRHAAAARRSRDPRGRFASDAPTRGAADIPVEQQKLDKWTENGFRRVFAFVRDI